MATRSVVQFLDHEGEAEAVIYRHWDGYPEEAGADLLAFIKRCRGLGDSRIGDPSYLAAKFVVFLAEKFCEGDDPLEFLGVGIVTEDDDCGAEWRYRVYTDGRVAYAPMTWHPTKYHRTGWGPEVKLTPEAVAA